MNTLPCKNCICFPLCKSQYSEVMNSPTNKHFEKLQKEYRTRTILTNKCILLATYIYSTSDSSFPKRRAIFHNYMAGDINETPMY